MSEIEKLAETVNKETPWWAAMPILAASIVGVPSFAMLAAGWFLASNVTRGIKTLEQNSLSELQQLNHLDSQQEGILRFVESDLRVQYRTCLAASKTDEAREACITAAERETELGLKPDKDGQ